MSRVPEGQHQTSRQVSGLAGQARRLAGRARRLGVTARRQIGERVRQRVRTVRSRQAALQPGEVARAGAFRHGYLVSAAGSSVPPAVAQWVRREVGTVTYRLHPSTRLTVAADAIVLLGDPVDVDADTADTAMIAQRLAGLRPDGTAAIVRAASRLGGRWTLFVHESDGRLTVVTDALASQGVWWDQEDVIASHRALLSTPVSALQPNTLLRVGLPGRDDHEVHCYWPAPEGSGADLVVEPGAAGRELRERLVTHTRLLATLGRPGLALTEGVASRALLAAYLRHPRDDGFAFTTFEVSSVGEGLGPVEHLFAASHLAQTVGLPHRVLEVAATPEAEPLAVAFSQTYPEGASHPQSASAGVARAYSALPEGTVVLHPAGAEVQDQATWEAGDHLRSSEGFPEGDLTQRVLLPFNDRRVIELLLSLSGAREDASAPLAPLVDELPTPTPALDA
ncbi:hypothetical protein [Ornithinimicrobium cryptoxanthini]|uniref:Uncharacterized protein n=1 Tax=Ornithinimicrobium cryptoxanthini TaxID=2934161 RepID=A0ABY4YI12_9MICO|nr:hypothetical protein [Ornithinimicrobium cryptoxanthini]USQ76319.1 hypothetical protein NF557_17310 [Ornithinimicrobium cryptoxanthini]